jgi:ABC-type nitrate/sulfonate/bicarbonate transport system permease component
VRAFLRSLVTPLLLLLYWQIVAGSGLVSNYLLPKPFTVWQSAVGMWQSGLLPGHINASLTRIVLGFSLSCAAGFLFAGLITRFRLLNELLAAPLALLRMIPPLAMTPLLILWLGIGSATQLTIIILASFFPIFLNARDGFARVSDDNRELARNLNLSAWAYVSRIVIPSAVPSIVTGLRLAFGYSWRALIGAELIAAASGLGYMVINAQEMLRTDQVFVGILTIGVIGWLLDSLFIRGINRLLGRRFPEIAA